MDSWSRDFDPGLWEQGTGNQNESNVEDCVEWISCNFKQVSGGRDIVSQSSDRDWMSSGFNILPLSEKSYEEVGFVSLVKDLWEEVKVGNEGGLEDDRDVWGVEKLNGIGSVLAVSLLFDLDVVFESLEVNDNEENCDGSHEIEEVGRGRSVECLI